MSTLTHDQLHKLTAECNQAIAAEYALFGLADAPVLTPGIVRVLASVVSTGLPLLERASLPPRWDNRGPEAPPPAAPPAPPPPLRQAQGAELAPNDRRGQAPKVRRTTGGRKMPDAERQIRSEIMKRVHAAKRAARARTEEHSDECEAEAAAPANGFRPED